MARRVLLVDGGAGITSLQAPLSDAGWRVSLASLCNEAIYLVSLTAFDVVVLDSILPDSLGHHCCRLLRERYKGCLIMVTHNESITRDMCEVDEDLCREMGGDCLLYLHQGAKALSSEILDCVERVEAEGRATDAGRLKLRYGDFTIDTVQELMWGPDGTVNEILSEDAAILVVLARQAGSPMPRAALCDALASIQGVRPTDKALTSRLHRLRKRLREAGLEEDILMTVHGKGLILVKPDQFD